MRLRVIGRQAAADGVVVFDLTDPAGSPLPPWEPGAHIDLCLPGAPVRQYSLCGDPADRGVWRIGVLRGAGASAQVHETLHPGRDVEVRGPRNHFALVEAERYLFVAGGIGITPILPMIRAAGTDWELHYGGRSRTAMAFLADLPDDPRITLYPQDEVGLIDVDRILARITPGTAVYCCGPEPLLTAVEQRCGDRPPHLERFAPAKTGQPVRSFEVHLAASGLTMTVPPDKSVLEVVEAAGIGVLSSCREGTCGTCETPVLDGRVEHRDVLLTPAERAANDTMFICVSRAAGPRLVLDL